MSQIVLDSLYESQEVSSCFLLKEEKKKFLVKGTQEIQIFNQ